MSRSIFRYEGPVWNFCNVVTDTLGLSLLWCLCSLPILTTGAATAALYDAAVCGVRYREPGTYRRFFRTFKAELKTSLLSTLLWGILLLFGVYVLALLDEAAAGNTQAALMAGGYRVLMALLMSAAAWSCMLLSRFAYRFRDLTANAIQFLPAHMLASIMIAVLSWASVWFVTHYPLGLVFAPAVTAIGWSLVSEPVFKKYGGGIEPAKADKE